MCGCLNLPDTFIEDIELIICQTFLLEDCDDGIVDAVTPNMQRLVFILLSYLNTICFVSWFSLVYLFQVALAPALFCFSPLSSGELFSLFPSSLRLGELINFSRCRVLMRENLRGWRETRVCTKYWTGEKEGQATS